MSEWKKSEAYRFAEMLDSGKWMNYEVRSKAAAELLRLHARVQELEAKEVNIEEFRVITTEAVRSPLLNRIRELETSKAQRVPLSCFQIERESLHDQFMEGVRYAERAHGIKEQP